ncbi:MAG: TIGR02452 family protein [Bacteroidota bacterium]
MKPKNIQTIVQTLDIIQRGQYKNAQGKIISIDEAQQKAEQGSRAWLPEELTALTQKTYRATTKQSKFVVDNTTTFEAAYQAYQAGAQHIAALNFASARNPGGGVLRGTVAQEEDLARSSGLYPCLVQMKDHYRYHRRHRLALYTDRMIYSPRVPVFRDAADQLFAVAH